MTDENDPFAGVDMNIINSALPPDVKTNLAQVQKNVSDAVDGVMTKFSKNLQGKLDALTADNSAKLQTELEGVFGEKFNPIADQLGEIKKAVAAMAEAAPDDADLKKSLEALSSQADSLDTVLNDAKAKVQTFGQTLGAGARQLVKSVVPFPLP